MITRIMQDGIKIICAAHGIKGRRPHYVNLWSMRKIIPFLLERGVPMEKINTLLEIYYELRFR